MDSLTHALTGSLIADALPFTPRLGRKAHIAAVAAAMAPDADMIIPFIGNFPPKSLSFHGLLNMDLVMTYHRSYTHSFFYTFLAALVLAFPLRRWLGGGKGSRLQWALLLTLAFFSHILLDITNPWLVRCWLPFSPRGEAWTLMPLMDWTFTGLLGLLFIVNNVLRDAYAPLEIPRPALPSWKEKSTAALNRAIRAAPLAWITAILLVLRICLTLYDIFPRPVLMS